MIFCGFTDIVLSPYHTILCAQIQGVYRLQARLHRVVSIDALEHDRIKQEGLLATLMTLITLSMLKAGRLLRVGLKSEQWVIECCSCLAVHVIPTESLTC